ncbi:Rieske (2Fe-2S) protein [Kitasatospora sp. YST-16]|uniref:Rieske 2Fe-2S domain-containing protein n=1 Tax=Kitasatospora sp. YST-16 TaxID=2998080 RepID=UPI0022835177|nr:Rieske (2Fe-2S) protein [Kitasatospora sp. YST-16]WAL70119.1 Rieske (2Fe-2S) protein [Kitasatospora sp. YST-16]WNW36159.1 Rieske (2Fe-2S) protein [Streptomyces sp. Li-HN-5-13]
MDRYRAPADCLDAPTGWTFLDPVAERIAGVVQRLPLGPARDVLHGVWLGHPLHPALAQTPIGCWTAASLLDATGGDPRAVRRLTAAGLVTLPPVLLAGWVDWSRLPPAHRRTGLVHAAGAVAAALLQGTSLHARCHGHPTRGRLLGLAGTGAVGLAAALGGHLAYRQAAGAAHAEAEPRLAPSDWHSLGATADIPADTPVRRRLGDVPVVVVRGPDDSWTVLADRCTHMAASLAGGEVVDGCLECPLHHSRFRLSDGRPARGPATAAQPRFETRVLADHLEARPRPGP